MPEDRVCAALGVVFGFDCLYEYDILPQGIFTDDVRTGYMLQVCGILLAVGLIPLSLRLFSLSLIKYVRTLPLVEL